MLFVMNPFAGTRRANRHLVGILSIFNRAGYQVTAHMTAGPGDAAQIVEKLAPEMDVVTCCGGDGTFNETVTGLMRSVAKVPIGYIPAGSTNDFATSLHLPTRILDAARAIVEGKAYLYDVGSFADRYFSYVASFGAFTKASYATPQNVKNALGHAAYVLSGIQEITQLHTTHMRLELDEEMIEDDFLFGAISNSTSVGGVLTLRPDLVDMADGQFEVLLIRKPHTLAELTECIHALQTQQYNCRMITFRSASKVHAMSAEPIVWTLDGERADEQQDTIIQNCHHAISLLQKG